MEDDVVLADEMDQAAVIAAPPFLPVLRQEFLGVGDVSKGSVKPHVKDLTFCTLYRNRDAPVQVTGHGTGLEMTVQPGLALAVNI